MPSAISSRQTAPTSDQAEQARAIIRVIKARGSHDSDRYTNDLGAELRFYSHEAHHALISGAKRWDTESIHQALTRKTRNRPGELVKEELDARAVEQVVCSRLGLDPGPVEHWADITWWETASNMKLHLPEVDWIVTRVTERLKLGYIGFAANRVIALGKIEPAPQPKPKRKRAR